MGCSHCMQNSTEDPQHMSMEIVKRTVKFAEWSHAFAILISGGEPTEHPKFFEIAKMFSKFECVAIISNGDFISDPDKTAKMKELLKRNNFSMQITSISGIYPRQVDLKALEALPHTVSHTEGINMLSLGRAATSPKYSEIAKTTNGTTSCFATALTFAQLPYVFALKNIEMRGKMCHPLIDWKGNLHISESWLCPSFANIFEDFTSIADKAHNWRPCGKCADYQKLLKKNDPQYLQAKQILGIK